MRGGSGRRGATSTRTASRWARQLVIELRPCLFQRPARRAAPCYQWLRCATGATQQHGQRPSLLLSFTQASCCLAQADDSLALMPMVPQSGSYQCIPPPLQQLFASGGLLGRLACLGAVERPAVARVLCRKTGGSLDDFICRDDAAADALMDTMRRQRQLAHAIGCSALADEVAATAYAPESEVDATHPQQVGGAPGMLQAGSARQQHGGLRRRSCCAGGRVVGTVVWAISAGPGEQWQPTAAPPLQVLRMSEARSLFAGVLDVAQPGPFGFLGFGVNLVHLTPAQLQHRTQVGRHRWGARPPECALRRTEAAARQLRSRAPRPPTRPPPAHGSMPCLP